MPTPPYLLPFPEDRPLAEEIARRLDARLGRLHWRHFPDGESLIAVDGGFCESPAADVVIVASMSQPDRKALPLRFAAKTAREMGARRVGLIAPYLAYMRQDARFHPGEAISAPLFAGFLEETVDWIVTVDPHLHRIASLRSVFGIPAAVVPAAPRIADWIRREIERPILVGPDSESAQWVADVAHHARLPYEVLHKQRHGDRDVEISLPSAERLDGYTPVLVDDMASTGRTLIRAVEQLRRFDLPPPVCVVIHPLFVEDAFDALRAAGAARVVSTDTLPHPSNAIGMAGDLAQAAAAMLGRATAGAPP